MLESGVGIDLVLQDMNFSRSTSGEEGMRLLGEIRRLQPQLPVILMTAWGTVQLAVKGMRAGAADFITKPWSHQQVLQAITTVLDLVKTRQRDVTKVIEREELDAQWDFSRIIGTDPVLLRVLDVVGRVADTDAPVLITGESGTGKELVADALWRNSSRKSNPFAKVNLGGIPTSLFESEMFGHVSGAFTDAKNTRIGRFESAHGGTLFLDEIGDLAPSSQVKLLRVLQDRTFEKVGSSKSQTVDVRLITATNRNLQECIEKGEFREDLFYRINLISVNLPSLRERKSDIPLLAESFLEELTARYNRKGITVDSGAIEWLRTRPWPGNIRQLRQLIERTVLLASTLHVTANALALAEDMQPEDSARSPLATPGMNTLQDVELKMVQRTLEYFDGNVTLAARSLGISRSSFYRKLEKLRMDS
ncbi:MAG: sigma-54 dependent transcriptional regulator, partial [bacterium]